MSLRARRRHKLEVTKHRVSTLLKNGLPESEDIRQEVLRMLGVMRDNTLREDWTNNLFAGALYYSLEDRENGMKCVEINIDFGYENDISLAMLQQMRNGIDPSALARDTLRGRRLNELISGLNERYRPSALALADYFDDRKGAIDRLESLASTDMNPLIAHTLRLAELRKADTSSFRKIYDLARNEVASHDEIPALYSGALRLVKDYADDGNIGAEIFIADMYNYGWGVQKDINQAMRYYVKAGNKKDMYSQFMYVNLELARNDYSQPKAENPSVLETASAEELFNEGMTFYGRLDYTEAFKYFSKSAQIGHAGSAYMIGYMLENGEGRAKSIATARSWYQDAANKGHDGAKKALERLSGRRSWW